MFGSKVVAGGDSKGCVLCNHGLDPVAIGKHKDKTSMVCNFPKAKPISNDKILALDVPPFLKSPSPPLVFSGFLLLLNHTIL
jgi:glutamate dehydrogenase/leucine dehydrogenase